MNFSVNPKIYDLTKFNYSNLFILYFGWFLLFQITTLGMIAPSESEGWLSDIAYNLNWEFNGMMGKDIPYGISWNTGIGKFYFLIHHLFYKIFGVGLIQARLVTLICGLSMLVLLYKWTYKYISKEVAVFSTFLFTVSPLYYLSIPDARPSVMHCLFGLLSFYFISSGVLTKKNYYFIITGFISAMSVDIDYRGIEIVLAVYIFYCVFFERGTFLKHLFLLLIGSSVYFVIWFSVNVLPIGIENFIKYNLSSAAGEAAIFSYRKFSSEIDRFINNLSGKRRFFTVIEVIYLTFFIAYFFKYKSKYQKISKIILVWLLTSFLTKSIMEKTTYIPHLLIYWPLICLIAGIGLYELLNNKKKLFSIAVVFLIVFSVISQGGILIRHIYHNYIKKDYSLNGYYLKLRESIDTNKNILGQTQHWYAFPNSQYYGGNFYLGRVMGVLKEIRLPNEYNNDYERAKAMLNVLEKRKIEYIVADEDFKLGGLMCYFPNNELPPKNFLVVNTIEDMFMGKGNESKRPPYKTEIYKIISYEP